MKILQATHDDVMVVTVDEPRINAAVSVAFKDAVRAAVGGHQGRVVLDVSAVEFLDSSGLGALVAVMKLMPGQKLELAGPGPVMSKVLALTKMDRVFVIHPDAAAATAPRTAA